MFQKMASEALIGENRSPRRMRICATVDQLSIVGQATNVPNKYQMRGSKHDSQIQYVRARQSPL